MGAADHHQRRPGIAYMNLITNIALFFPRFPLCSAVHHVHDGRVDHTKYRLTVINQRNIDGKFAVALEKLFGTVKRVHQPVTLPVLTNFPGRRIFLRQDRNVRRQRGEPCDDNFVGGDVSRRHRGVIGFLNGIKRLLTLIDLHNGVSRLARQLAYLF